MYSSGQLRDGVDMVRTDTTLEAGRARALFAWPDDLVLRPSSNSHGVAPDGQHFLVIRTVSPPPDLIVTDINLIQNWFEEVKATVPTGR